MQNTMRPILVTVNLPGVIEGPVKHTTKQRHTVALSEEHGFSMSKIIKHTDRKIGTAVRSFTVAEEHVESWTRADEVPYWEDQKEWKLKTPGQRIVSHVLRFDEGYGVNFEFLGDKE